MSLWRRRQEYSATIPGNVFITLAQIGLMFAAVILWLVG